MYVMRGLESRRDVALTVRWKTRCARVSAKVHSVIMTMLLKIHQNGAPPEITQTPTCLTTTSTLFFYSLHRRRTKNQAHDSIMSNSQIVRNPSHAGSWYTSSKSQLNSQLDGWLDDVKTPLTCIGPQTEGQEVKDLPVPGARIIIGP
jgi:hypothetical protein